MSKPTNYAEAGVDRDQEERSVKSILEMIKMTYSKGYTPEGHYAGSIPFGDHLLSLANDGVGSKLILAQKLDKHDTIGIDAVAMCVNDLITIGSIPAAFVDYIAIREPTEDVIKEIMKGLVNGCIESEIPLVGGETATLPDVIQTIANNNGYDVAGTALGIHKQSDSITGEDIQAGDRIIGVRSAGIHSNGLTLARKLVNDEEDRLELLKPTRIYVKMVKSILKEIKPTGMAHITGGGMTNLLRLGKFEYSINKIDLVKIHPIFEKLQNLGDISNYEMYRTFNMGIGFVLIVKQEDEVNALKLLNNFFPSFTIGEIKAGNQVKIKLEDETIIYQG